MKKEPQIFTQIDAQNVRVSADILDTLEQEAVSESAFRKYIKELLVEKDILAIGMCFPFAHEMAQKWWSDHIDRTKPRGEGIHPDLDNKSKFKVVHGTVTNKWHDPPKAVVHAWVEMGDMIFDDQTKVTKPNGVPRDVYYDMFQPEIRNEYTAEEAVMKCSRTGSPGPWDEESLGYMSQRDAWLDEGLIREEAQVNMLMRDVDDILDDAIRDAAPEIVRDIREREVDEDIDEFIDGAIHGSWDTKELDYADPPNVGDSTEVMDSGDNEEVTEMYRLGYTWGWNNPSKIEGGEAIPDATRAEMIEYALENFKSRVTEEFVINALEKATSYVKQQLGDVHHLLKKAKDKFGWKFAPILVSIEVVEHAVLPAMLGAIHPIFYGLAAVPTVEILAASALAIAKARMPSAAPAEIPPGHLDWYEEEYRASANESALREYVKELLKEGVEFRTLDSPLTYNRAGNVKRIALCDTSVKERNTSPTGKPQRDSYFNEYQETERYGASGRRLKKPRKGKLVPGVSDACVIGFLDYHQQAKNSDGSSYWYIDYMKTRGDKGGQGTASKLIDEFYNTVAQPGDNVHFGKMMQPQIGHLKDKMVDKYPDIDTIGAKYF